MSDFKYYADMNEEEKEDFIEDLVKHYDEFTTSDLQAVIMARCFKDKNSIIENMLLTDEILDIVYERTEKGA